MAQCGQGCIRASDHWDSISAYMCTPGMETFEMSHHQLEKAWKLAIPSRCNHVQCCIIEDALSLRNVLAATFIGNMFFVSHPQYSDSNSFYDSPIYQNIEPHSKALIAIYYNCGLYYQSINAR
jgi:hypothetical protein